jgi:uncharacterized protein (DUF1697 family)
MPSTRYVAFLRGINVGGHKIIKMDRLRLAFEELGMRKVTTILASGNVLFESGVSNPATLTTKLETGLEKALGHSVGVVLRTLEQIERLERAQPFKGVIVSPSTRLWITFLPAAAKGKTEVPHVIELTGNLRAGMDLMDDIDRKYGKHVTTRSWNTIGRILKAAKSE